ncbi:MULTISPECIES: phosphate ABC transporter substrate-binding protein PstS [Aerosakkonema]|uniref:phosphate ABC transporter substrate-binding protein PstS n=1 Tax=Aerosakkonema TaxID=1246629 RepID=UPI0035B7CAA4
MLFFTNLVNRTRLATSISVVALTLGLAACGGNNAPNNTANSSPSPGTSSEASPSTSTASGPQATGPGKLDLAQNVQLTGAGASFPAPLYQRWFVDLNKKYPKLQINYQSIGSGAGVEQFTAGTVDFGASDVAMKDEEIAKVQKGVLLLPMTAGNIVIAYNLPNVETGLKLPRDVYTDIFLGKIKSWNDPKIVAANPGVTLPNQPITVVSRSDGSGTTGVFTKHLAAISPEFKEKVGEGKTVKWPTGIAAKGNEGVTAQILQTQGALGYVEYGYAKQTNLKYAALQNKAGTFVVPNEESAAKTLESVTLPENLRAFIEDPEGQDSYPIVTYTWLLVYKQYPDLVKAKAIEAMIEYGLTEGQKNSPELGYVPLPKSIISKIAAAADQISPDYKIDVGSATASQQ